MQSLKKLANKAASSMIYNDDVSSNAQEEIWNLTNTIQHQKLHLMELEENVECMNLLVKYPGTFLFVISFFISTFDQNLPPSPHDDATFG